jgi:phosphoribosyl-dephospho-CoA transferase
MISVAPRVHDLIQLRRESALLPEQNLPAWLPAARKEPLWVVVRRGPVEGELVPIGVRGSQRHERWAGFVRMNDVLTIQRPDGLRLHLAQDSRRTLLAFQTLEHLECHLIGSDLNWGPGGSVGYELASGVPAVRSSSDLDLVFFAPGKLNHTRASELWQTCSSGPGRIDGLVETPCCGFSLQEYATSSTKKLLLRTPNGRMLGPDPWDLTSGEVGKAEVS